MTRCHKMVAAGKRCLLPVDHDANCTLGPIVEIDYKNWKGVRRLRRVVPLGGKMLYQASPPYHPKAQWLMGCIDCEDGGHKWFAMDGIYSWREVEQ